MSDSDCSKDSIDFDFWGTTVRIFVSGQTDEKYLSYYFEDFLTSVEKSDIEISLHCNSGTFTTSEGVKRVEVRYPGQDWWTYECYSTESKRPTPLPPFGLRPFNELVVTIHASAATPPDVNDQALVIHGPSTSGKSTLLRTLSKNGWRFVTDDTLVQRKTDGALLRYCRPLGIRQAAYESDTFLRRSTDGAISFSTPTGVTRVATATELGFTLADRESQWVWTVVLDRSGHFASKRLGPTTLRLSLDIDRHLDQALDAILALTGSTTEKF